MSRIYSVKKGKLHIYVRQDKYKGKLKSHNWVGRTYIQGKQKIKSSGISNFKKAQIKLEQWFDELHFKKKHGLQIHENSFGDCLKQFLKSLDTTQKIRGTTKQWYRERFNYIKQCKELMILKVGSITETNIEKTFIVWRLKRAKTQNKVLRGATLKGDLTAISGFLTWCYKNKFRKTRLENIALLLNKKLREQRTNRTLFTKDEWNKLKQISRDRIIEGRTARIKFDRQRLHQFMVFMVGSGLRVDEALNLEWEDITFVDRQKSKGIVDRNIQLDEDSRYCLKINVGQSKTKSRETYSTASSYFALQRLIKLYKETGLGKIKGVIWGVKSFRDGLNSLLNIAELKTVKIGDAVKSRDSKSFRNTYIQFMLDKGVNSNAIGKLIGTSSTMIDKFYTANTAIESMLDVILKTGRTKLKAVS